MYLCVVEREDMYACARASARAKAIQQNACCHEPEYHDLNPQGSLGA